MQRYAQLLIIADGSSSAAQADPTARWHQENRVWLCNSQPDFPVGEPVVARMAGPSNELLIDGIVAGQWGPSRFTDWPWRYEIAVVWSRHVVHGVRARDVLPAKGLLRPSHIELTQEEWAAVQYARHSV